MKKTVKYLDFVKLNDPYRMDFKKNLDNIFDSGQILMGKYTRDLEQKLSSMHDDRYSIGVSNGLDALRLIFKAYIELGLLSKGDKVIIPANTYIASILPVIEFGLVPILVEPNLNTMNLDWDKVDERLISECKAIIIVHLYGRICYSEKINYLKKRGIIIIEDNAQSIGAKVMIGEDKNLIAGAIGDASAFSFYPGKNTGALGDAGAIITNNLKLFEVIKALRNYGSEKKYFNKFLGYNCRISEFNASFTLLKINNLDEIINKRRKIAEYYLKNLKNIDVILPNIGKDASKNISHVWHIFHLLIKNGKRDIFQDYLKLNDIFTVIHYPIPIHKQEAVKDVFNSQKLPLTEMIHESVISIPLNETMSESQIHYVVQTINSCKLT